jgi:hypothetical protein
MEILEKILIIITCILAIAGMIGLLYLVLVNIQPIWQDGYHFFTKLRRSNNTYKQVLKKNKTAEELVRALLDRGIDDIVQNRFGDSITCTEDPELEKLYLACIKPMTDLQNYLDKKYKDFF